MAKRTYGEISDSVMAKIKNLADSFDQEEIACALSSSNYPSDIRKQLLTEIAERLMKESKDNDDLMVVALSHAEPSNKEAAEKILANNPSEKHLTQLMRSPDIVGWEIVNRASKMLDKFIFSNTIREENK